MQKLNKACAVRVDEAKELLKAEIKPFQSKAQSTSRFNAANSTQRNKSPTPGRAMGSGVLKNVLDAKVKQEKDVAMWNSNTVRQKFHRMPTVHLLKVKKLWIRPNTEKKHNDSELIESQAKDILDINQ